ncbi:DUF6703 family protein [Marinactinospora rubrisoli]|uniref:DUF6703 family protein n=1 Tax=Marinactinospora rubrisoli TaxID=2715399 RepID=A0ABW2KIH9_9ACTN
MSRKRNKPQSRRPSPAPGRPLPEGDTFFTPEAGALRRTVERRSAVPLVWLHNAPRWVLPVGMAVVFTAGLLAAGVVGAVLLGVLAVFFGWLAFLAWPRLRGGERAMRVVVVVTLLGLAVLQVGS